VSLSQPPSSFLLLASNLTHSSYHIGIAYGCAILGYGDENNPIMRALKSQETGEVPDQVMDSNVEIAASKQLRDTIFFANKTHVIILRRHGDPNILPNLHVTLMFAHHRSFYPGANAHFALTFPWKLLSLMLDTVLVPFTLHSVIESERSSRKRARTCSGLYPRITLFEGCYSAKGNHLNKFFL